MANFTASRLGLVNTTGTGYDALFLKVFAGEVLSAFKRVNVFGDTVQTRTIQNGKSAQFPVTGRFTAAFHTPGDMIVGDLCTDWVASRDGETVTFVNGTRCSGPRVS